MKNRFLPTVVLVAFVALAWIYAGYSTMSYIAEGSGVSGKIEKNEEVRTYINVISDYDTMISREPENIDWYIRKAEAYKDMERINEYSDTCKRIVEVFPDRVEGYQMLSKYYEDSEDYSALLELYLRAPEGVQSDGEFNGRYTAHEYEYTFASGVFESATSLDDNGAVAKMDGLYGFLNKEGSTVVAAVYQDAHPMADGVAAVYGNDEWFQINSDGYRVHASTEKIEDLYAACEGLVLAKIGGSYGYLDENLENPMHFEYEAASCFLNGVAAVKKGGKWCLVDAEFNELTGYVFDDVLLDDRNTCSRKGYVFAKQGGTYALYDTSGNRVGTEQFESAKPFADAEGLAAVCKDGKWGFVDMSGALKLECKYDDACSSNLGLAPVKEKGKWKYIHTDGSVAVETEFDSIGALNSKGYSLVVTGDVGRFIRFLKFGIEIDEQ